MVASQMRAEIIKPNHENDWVFLLTPYNGQYWVSLANIDGDIAQDKALCPADSQSCYGWMP
jgi:hypothetical protein